jgi:hypothetical protein
VNAGATTTARKGPMRRMLFALGLVALTSFQVQAQTAQSGRATTILFVGNSFVHGNFEPVVSYRKGVVDENAGLSPNDPRFETIGGKPAGRSAALPRFSSNSPTKPACATTSMSSCSAAVR